MMTLSLKWLPSITLNLYTNICNFLSFYLILIGGRLRHTGQCKRTGGYYNELVVAFFSTGGGVKGKQIYTC